MKEKPRSKVPIGLRIELELLERLRNAVFWVGRGLTVNGICEAAIIQALTALEAQHNGGVPFQPRTGPISKGQA